MNGDDERVLHTTSNAEWLPPRGGTAQVIALAEPPPRPMSLVRLLLRREDRVFCVPRERTGGKLDLPTRLVGEHDPQGALAIAELARCITRTDALLTFIGAVRNTVDRPSPGYGWPAPVSHFGVWGGADADPVVDGVWLPVGRCRSELADRHWYPLLGATSA